MAPAMLMKAETQRDDDHGMIEYKYHKGVKNLCDIGITRLPKKYILPVLERPTLRKPYASYQLNLELPIIDLAELQGPNRAQVLSRLAHACENYGFFQLVNHGIGTEVISKMTDVGRKFFELPLVEREKFMSANIQSTVRYGTSFNQTKDGVFCWRDFLKLVCNSLSDVVCQWPSSPVDFREAAVTYAKETKQLYLDLVEAILESLGVLNTNAKTAAQDESEKFLSEMEDGSQLMVLNCYPPCPQPDLTLGMPPHSDYGFLTLLLQDEVEGLQINFQQQWLTIQPIPNSFVVNVGDHLEIFSNGRYKSVLHRVLVNSMKSRISVASLHSLPFNCPIRPSLKLISESNPRIYKDTTFTDFLEYISSCDSKKKNFLQSRRLS